MVSVHLRHKADDPPDEECGEAREQERADVANEELLELGEGPELY